ncbi:MAG: pentapeptide repeat-containing protein [bacterium]|nr:pentapeptide repeat-containing protein [bacterium]
MELVSFGMGADWIVKLYKKLKSIRKKNVKALNEINDIMYSDPLELAKYYVEPGCQESNPADRREDDFLVAREPIYKKIDEFFKARKLDQPGNNQLFVLSDAGMGKTSLLAMLKLLHLTSFWPKNTDCILRKLGTETLAEISAVGNKRETILLLDALDEDPEAYGRVQDRLLEILEATKSFHRVIITCRTQFFPDVEAGPFGRPGIISLGGFVCPAKYLSLFDDERVELYLNKRFPGKFLFFKPKDKIERAKGLEKQMGSLRCRPMLLAYIEELMESPLLRDKKNEYIIYNALVTSWLTREEGKNQIPKSELFRVCERLALEMSIKGVRDISAEDLELLIADISELKRVKAIDIKGRSLLNKNSLGNYRFSHYSIQEFLVAKRLMENPALSLDKKLHLTDIIAKMLITNDKFMACHHFFDFDIDIFKSLDIQGADLKKIELKGAELVGLDLKGADLKGVRLSGFNYVATTQTGSIPIETRSKRLNFLGADLQVADFQEATLDNAIFEKANLLGANFKKASLKRAKLRMATLSWADLNEADLQNADLQGANLQGVSLQGANLQRANLQGGNLQGANLRETDLKNANLNDANLQEVDISGAKNITVDMLLKTKSLYQIKGLSPKKFAILKNKKPELFEKPPNKNKK